MKVLTIANIETPVVEYSNQPVVTTAQLADFYECKPLQIQQNFKNNTDRFIEGKHYFKLEGELLKAFKNSLENIESVGIGLRAPSIMLWTKQGAARHSKMLGTDRAWDMFDLLEENYFNQKQEPKSQIDILVESAKALQRQERELARLKLTQEEHSKSLEIVNSRMDTLNGVCTKGTKRQKLVAMINAYSNKHGLTYREGWHRFKQAYNFAFHTSLGNSISFYMKDKGLKKKPSVPDFLEKKELLDDAMRIADKLLNAGGVCVG